MAGDEAQTIEFGNSLGQLNHAAIKSDVSRKTQIKDHQNYQLHSTSIFLAVQNKVNETSLMKAQVSNQEAQGKSTYSNNTILNDAKSVDNVSTQLQSNAIEENVMQLTSSVQQIECDSKSTDLPPPIEPNSEKNSNVQAGKEDRHNDKQNHSKKPQFSIPHDLNKPTSNFKKHVPNSKSKQKPLVENHAKDKGPANSNNNPKNKHILEPDPFTIVHSFATKMRSNHAKNETLIELSILLSFSRKNISW